jgi:CRP-like cAMP-binding protein
MKTENQLVKTLASSSLFAGHQENEIRSLIELAGYQVKEFKTGRIIASEGERCRSLMMVINGSVKGEMIDFSGRVLKIEDISAPRPLATAFLFGKDNRFPVTITATETVDILIFSKSSVLNLMQNSEVFLTNFLNAVCNRAQFISEKLRFLSFKSLKSKIGNYLLELQKEQQGAEEIHLKHTHAQLADLFGVARPSLSRSLRELHRAGVVEAEGKLVRIINPQALLSMTQE